VHTWSAVSDSNAREGALIAFGEPLTTLYSFDRARVIVSLDSDFLQTESGSVRSTKMFASGRRLRSSKDTMSRLYVVEPGRTVTGMNADHRLRLAASDVERFAHALATELTKNGVTLGDDVQRSVSKATGDGIPPQWLGALAKDLAANRGRAVVVVGSRQPASLHALGHALNAALGAVGASLSRAPAADPDKLAKVPFSVHASLFVDETSENCTWHVPRAHAYESWGDERALDGSTSVRQPLIAPLYDGRGDIELLAFMANAPEKSAHEAVRGTVRTAVLGAHGLNGCGPLTDGKVECHDAAGNAVPVHATDLEREWNRALALGVSSRPQQPPPPPVLRGVDVAAAIDKRVVAASVGPQSLEVTFAPCPKMVDGAHANNTWLQEMPDPVTKLVWDNAAIVSPATAKALGIESKDLIK